MSIARQFVISVALLAFAAGLSPVQAYNGMEADYQACTQGSGKVSNRRIVQACTRLIDNAARENELVGFFHALRASANTDRSQNCQDAKVAKRLLKGAKLQQQVTQLLNKNCQSAAVRQPAQCMQANADAQIAEGRVEIDRFKDAAGRAGSAYILALPVPTCLSSNDPDERVESTVRIHFFASEDVLHQSIGRFVGQTVLLRGRPSPAHTVHHRAPIIMDINAIDVR